MTTKLSVEEQEKTLFKDGESVNLLDFLSSNDANTQKIKRMTEALYSCERCQEPIRTATMRTLLTDPKYYNDEQIWSQIKLFNDPLLNYIESEISDLSQPTLNNDNIEEEEEEEEEYVDDEIENEAEDEIVSENDEDKMIDEDDDSDDDDENDNDEEEDEEDYYDELYGDKLENDDDEQTMYKDFFGDEPSKGEFDSLEFPEMDEDGEFIQSKPSNSKKVNFDYEEEEEEEEEKEEEEEEEKEEEEEDEFDRMDRELEEQEEEDFINENEEDNEDNEEDEEEDDDENESEEVKEKTPHELELERMEKKIAKLEDENVNEKDWSMMGEVSKFDRPENSLLDAYVEFQTANKAAPEVSPEVTEEINELIKNRIKNALFDDVIPKTEKGISPDARFGTKIMTLEEQEKASKMGLAEVYEQEFRNKMLAGANNDIQNADDVTSEDKLTPQQKYVQNKFRSLCVKLDILTNFRYTPKPVDASIKVMPNVAAIRVEEKVPISVNRASLLAPEEIYAQKKEVMTSKDEMTREEKRAAHASVKRERRKQLAESGIAGKRKREEETGKAGAMSAAAKLKMDTIAGQANKEIDNRRTKSFGSKKFFTDLQNKQNQPELKKARRDNNVNSYSSTSMSSKL